MGYYQIVEPYYYENVDLVLELLANTPGNNNSSWIDTSSYATPATQSNSLYQPVLTNDVFGDGNKGYIFDGSDNFMIVGDSDRFSFTNNTSDSPFSIEISFKFNTVSECWFVNKRSSSTNLEYQISYYASGWYFVIYDTDYQHYIGCRFPITPVADYNYVLKFTYDGSGLATGTKIYQNGVILNVIPLSSGSFSCMKNSSSSINIARFGQGGYYMNGSIRWVKIWKGVV